MSVHLYSITQGRVQQHQWQAGETISPDMVWIDLHDPTREEELAVEQCVGMDIPTHEEMHEIEVSNRLYDEDGHAFMIASLVTKFDSDKPEIHAVTFIVSPRHLITVRYSDPQPFRTYSARLTAVPQQGCTGYNILVGLLEAIINRAADVLEIIAQDIDAINRDVFKSTARDTDYHKALHRIGKSGDVASKVRESLTTLGRVVLFAGQNLQGITPELNAQLTVQRRDIAALNDHAAFVTNKLSFLLDATLGMISIQQNNIIKIFSIAAVVFLPPTLIASIYGMNFKHMPELNWPGGYPMALVLMVIAAALPLWYFKRKKWL